MVLVRKTGWEVMVLFWYQCYQKKSGLYKTCPLPQVLVQVSVIGWASPSTTANNIGDETKTDTVLIMRMWPLLHAINKACHLHFNKLQQTSKQAVVTFMSRQVVMSFSSTSKLFYGARKYFCTGTMLPTSIGEVYFEVSKADSLHCRVAVARGSIWLLTKAVDPGSILGMKWIVLLQVLWR